MICESLRIFLGGKGGIFLGDWKLYQASGFWESLAQMASAVKIKFPTLIIQDRII